LIRTFGWRDYNNFGEVIAMNEERIQQVLEIEKRAQEIHEDAKREAEQLLKQVDRRLVESAQAEEETAKILADAEEKINRSKNLAKGNLDRAVGFVLDRVAGRE
jgi:F0F1-type ATP synthase membrane subunit b/b'